MNALKEFKLKRNENDIDKWHHYYDIYDRHLKKYTEYPINMLEIGVFKGGSVKMWSDYFDKQSTIYGIDISEHALAHNNYDNIKIVIGDQSDRNFLNEFLKDKPGLDVVIDDGGHTASQQINSFEVIYPQMSSDGIYIVEDTHTSYMKEYKDLGSNKTFIEYTKKLIDKLHDWWRGGKLSSGTLIQGFTLGSDFDDSQMRISDFCKMTCAIHIYESMVIFEKGPRSHPMRDNIKSDE